MMEFPPTNFNGELTERATIGRPLAVMAQALWISGILKQNSAQKIDRCSQGKPLPRVAPRVQHLKHLSNAKVTKQGCPRHAKVLTTIARTYQISKRPSAWRGAKKTMSALTLERAKSHPPTAAVQTVGP